LPRPARGWDAALGAFSQAASGAGSRRMASRGESGAPLIVGGIDGGEDLGGEWDFWGSPVMGAARPNVAAAVVPDVVEAAPSSTFTINII